MWLDEEKPISKRDLVLTKPFVNAAGVLGFTPDVRRVPAITNLGVFITHPISIRPRQPAVNRTYLPFAGGFLLHTGLPNPGINQAVRRYRRSWESADLPIIVHVLVETPASLAEMVRKLEGLENIIGIELGLPPGCEPPDLSTILSAGVGELPLIPCLEPEQVPLLRDSLQDMQPAMVHLVEPRGALPGAGGELVSGRLYGPAIFPVMLKAAQVLVSEGMRVMANGGITARWQVNALMEIGVSAAGLGSVLWGLNPQAIFAPRTMT